MFIGAGNGSGSDPGVELVTAGGIIPASWLIATAVGGDCPYPECESNESCGEGEEAICFCDGGIWPGCDEVVECSSEPVDVECSAVAW